MLVSEAGIEAYWQGMHSGTIVMYIGRLADKYFWLRDRNYSQQSGKKAGRH